MYTDLEDEVSWQILGRAMRDPDQPGTTSDPYPVPLGSVDDLRDALTVDERDVLMSEYMDFEDEVDPDPMFKPDEWHEQIEEALKKNDRADCVRALSTCGSRMLVGYLLSTVRPQLISPIGKSSSSPEDTRTQTNPQD